MSILVRAPNWLGDVVMSLPALAALRQGFPGERIVGLARSGVAGIYELSGLCDEVLVIPSPHGRDGWRGTMAAARAMRERRFRAGLVLPNSFESALSLWLARVPERWGYRRDGRGILLTNPVTPPAKGEIPRHEVFYYLELLRRLGLIPALPETAVPALHLRDEAREQGRAILARHGLADTVVAITPGAANSRAKQWSPDSFVEAACLAAGNLRAAVAVFGTPQERELCASIANRVAAQGYTASNLAGETSLAEFVCAISQCRLLITNDSGGMHVGYSAGVPTVAVFGPTIHEETGPLGAHTRVVREPVECSPCMLKDCPIDHRCMTRVTPEHVLAEARQLVPFP